MKKKIGEKKAEIKKHSKDVKDIVRIFNGSFFYSKQTNTHPLSLTHTHKHIDTHKYNPLFHSLALTTKDIKANLMLFLLL